jgi:protein-tyrosine phosphatase
MHPEAAPVLERLGGDSSNFTARQLTAKIASAADLILTMTRAHRDAALELAPHRLHRTFTLSEASRLISEHGAKTVADLAARRSLLTADELLDIPDPIGQSSEVFAEIGEQIAHLLPPIFEVCQPVS